MQYTILTYFSPMSHVYTPWKPQKTFGYVTLKYDIGLKWVKGNCKIVRKVLHLIEISCGQ